MPADATARRGFFNPYRDRRDPVTLNEFLIKICELRHLVGSPKGMHENRAFRIRFAHSSRGVKEGIRER